MSAYNVNEESRIQDALRSNMSPAIEQTEQVQKVRTDNPWIIR